MIKPSALLKKLLRAHEGPLTRELTLEPGRFGLGRVPARLAPDATTDMVCGYCSTGCALTVHLRQGRAVNLTPARGYPVNLGMACPKGWEALTPLTATDRAVIPLLRNARGKQEPVPWERALCVFVRRVRAIQERHGAASVAFLSTGQIVSEEMALLGALAKFGMGMVHGDGNTRQCMATAVTAYKESFGFDAPPFSYRDLEESDVVVLVGSNLCIAHPILWQRLARNRHRPAIIVVDPRKTETAMAGTEHVAPRPKSDLALFTGILNVLVGKGWIDHAWVREHTVGFDELRAHAAQFPVDRVAELTGIAPARIVELARTIARGKRVSFWWTMGVNQSHEGVRTAQALINLALVTGNIGRPGTGANSITGQCNAMGSRLWSNTSSLFGGRSFTSAEDRAEVARILDIPVEKIPAQPSLAYDQIVEGVLARKIRALWIVGTNPAHSWINQADFHDVLGRLDFLVVQDMYASTETASFAHLVLPAAGWGEKEGTFINSERRIGVIRPVASAPGQALSDFRIFQLVAEAWGVGEMFQRWRTPEAVFAILRELSRGRPCDITGIEGYEMLAASGGVQWPHPEGAPSPPEPERRLFGDGRFFHADGKARLLFDVPRPLPEPADARYPFTLSSGRGSSSQWHTQTRTGKSPVLRRLHPQQIYVEINPVDARRLGIAPNEWVRVVSRRAELQARAFVTHAVAPGQLFVPMHYAETNRLTFPAFDPHSRQPAYKACAVAVERLDEQPKA
ncbi:MAG TPA: nitrate reductase [Polyangia bacterium]|nr:nitrate reductase [Polyangia bacterium]